VTEAQIGPTDLSLAVVYTLIDPKTGKKREHGSRARGRGADLVVKDPDLTPAFGHRSPLTAVERGLRWERDQWDRSSTQSRSDVP
jgi:hypothetical protein